MASLENRLIRCYAEGWSGQWEAFCLDFDLAVQGSSFQEVFQKLQEQIELYAEGLAALPEADARRLINRRAPHATWRWLYAAAMTLVWNVAKTDRPEQACYRLRLADGHRAAA